LSVNAVQTELSLLLLDTHLIDNILSLTFINDMLVWHEDSSGRSYGRAATDIVAIAICIACLIRFQAAAFS